MFSSACSASREHANTARLTRGEKVRGALAQLRAREAELRREALGTLRFTQAHVGADPVRLCPLRGGLVGLVQGRSELVMLDAALNEVARTSAPPDPVACAALGDSELVVVGARPELWIYVHSASGLELSRRVRLPHALSPRAVATRAGVVYVADSAANALYVVRGTEVRAMPLCRRPIGLALAGNTLVVNCLHDHELSLRQLDESGEPASESVRIENDGPFWALSAVSSDDGALIAATGVENRPLQRFDGAFGYVDSFTYLFQLRGAKVERLWTQNVSEQSLIVPKAIVLERAPGQERVSLWVSSAGTDCLARYQIDAASGTSTFESFAFAPGVSELVRLGGTTYAASPLLDAWVTLKDGATRPAFKSEGPRSPEADQRLRIGEALAFTTLMAPHASSEGRASRFTCETCHFEGGVDARVHHTGRGSVHVVTRPLFGLLRNAPHFSRALDPDLASVAHNEFRVANLGNPVSPWFALRAAEFPWLASLGVLGEISPEAQRAALLEFLARFEFPPNPRTRDRSTFTSLEAEGARLFRDHCERCHAARMASDEPSSRVPFDGWERSLFELGGPIVWARGDYEQTLVLPYVNERGTRIASLRRVADKYPYFTNGSALSLDGVVERSGAPRGYFSHAAAQSQFSAPERGALVAFLSLL
jgi:hypothetical protein